jgi:hypothetical protein
MNAYGGASRGSIPGKCLEVWTYHVSSSEFSPWVSKDEFFMEREAGPWKEWSHIYKSVRTSWCSYLVHFLHSVTMDDLFLCITSRFTLCRMFARYVRGLFGGGTWFEDLVEVSLYVCFIWGLQQLVNLCLFPETLACYITTTTTTTTTTVVAVIMPFFYAGEGILFVHLYVIYH